MTIGSLGLVRNNNPASERHKPLELAPLGVATRTLEEDLGIHGLERLPLGCRRGDNANVSVGGLRLWENEKIWEAAKK